MEIVPTEYGSPYKGIFFGSASRPVLSRLASRADSRQASKILSSKESKTTTAQNKKVEDSLDLVLKSITMAMQGVQNRLEKTEELLGSFQKQFNSLLIKMKTVNEHLVAIISNEKSEFESRQQIITKLLEIKEQYFIPFQIVSLSDLSERKGRFDKKSTSVIPSQLSSSPLQSMGTRPEIKIMLPGSFTPNPPVSTERSQRIMREAALAENAKAGGLVGKIPSASQPPRKDAKDGASVVVGMKQATNTQMMSPKADDRSANFGAAMNPKELRLRLQRIESSASHHGSRAAKDFHVTSSSQFKPDEGSKQNHDSVTAPKVPPLPNLSNLGKLNILGDARLAVNDHGELKRRPSHQKMMTQQTLEKQKLNRLDSSVPEIDGLDEVGKEFADDSSLSNLHRSDLSPKVIDHIITPQPMNSGLPKKLNNLSIPYETSSNQALDDVLQGAISPIACVPANSLGRLRHPSQTYASQFKTRDGADPSPMAHRFQFTEHEMDIGSAEPKQNSEPNNSAENGAMSDDIRNEDSDDDRNLAMNLLQGMKSKSPELQTPVETPVPVVAVAGNVQTPNEENQNQAPQHAERRVFEEKRETLVVTHAEEPLVECQDSDETISKFTTTKRRQSNHKGMSPNLRLIQETDYPDFGQSGVLENRSEYRHTPIDFMDYDLEPGSRLGSNRQPSSISSKNYRVSSRIHSSRSKSGTNSIRKGEERPTAQVLIKKQNQQRHKPKTGSSNLSQQADLMNYLEVPGKLQEPPAKKGFFSKLKPKPSHSPREYSAPMPMRMEHPRKSVPDERSHRISGSRPRDNRMTINLALSPRMEHSDIDVGLTLHVGRRDHARQEHSAEQERYQDDRAVDKNHRSRSHRKYP